MEIRRVRECADVSEYTGSGTGHIHSALREPAAIITPATKNERNFTFMKLLYLDCGMGAAGDMLGAALAELLPDDARDAFTSELNAAGIPGVHVSLDPSVKCGITGTHLTVTVNGTEEKEGGHSHSHEHSHHDHQHDHAHDHSHSHDHHHDHSHRSLHDIHHIIDDLKLPEAVRTDILAVYRLIAEAESKAHDKPVSEIHFHEVGTMDAIADIASVCLLLHKLAPDQIIASPIHVGSGQVKCAHGILPVPAPATAYILKDIPIYSGSIQGELCTPTGAALLKHFVTRFDQMPLMTPASTGYGMGTKDFPAANCVRAILGESFAENQDAILGESFAENQPEQPACIPTAPASAAAPASTATPTPAIAPASTATPAPAAAPASEEAAITETICELSCNVDDMTGEDIAFAIETFLQNGALDAFTVPCTMKKGRPGVLVTVLCKNPDQKQMTRLILQHTTTLGVRSAIKKRWILSRTESETVIPDDMLANVTSPDMPAESKAHELKTTGNGCTIRSKTSTGFGITRNKYEHDDLEKIARTYGLTLAQVRALLAALHQLQ